MNNTFEIQGQYIDIVGKRIFPAAISVKEGIIVDIQQISEARAHGDLSENAEYHAAKEAQSLNEGRIAELEDKLSRAEVIDVSKLSGSTIKFGATVTVVDEDTEEEKAYQIVGESEADVKSGRVSLTSPIARALIGKKAGDTVEVKTPGGGKSYEILKVAFV